MTEDREGFLAAARAHSFTGPLEAENRQLRERIDRLTQERDEANKRRDVLDRAGRRCSEQRDRVRLLLEAEKAIGAEAVARLNTALSRVKELEELARTAADMLAELGADEYEAHIRTALNPPEEHGQVREVVK